jgi:nitroimidazol reductase NimA-like FMN-containing flavoprotein (pyridoxamine 5'-phosphate oxidase superfamily)
MASIDKSQSGGEMNTPGTDGENPLTLESRIRYLVEDQLYGVLCTQSDGQPYGSMVAFAFTEDLRHVVFGTPKATKKYEILTACRNVALVVNNMNRHPNDLMNVEALTAIGRASEIMPTGPATRWASMLLQRHPYLEAFFSSSSTALFKVEIARFFCVRSFQEVTEWAPPCAPVEPPLDFDSRP